MCAKKGWLELKINGRAQNLFFPQMISFKVHQAGNTVTVIDTEMSRNF